MLESHNRKLELRRLLYLCAFLCPFYAWAAGDECAAVFYEPFSVAEFEFIMAAQGPEDTLLLPPGKRDKQAVHQHGEKLMGKLSASANLSAEQQQSDKYAILNYEQIEVLLSKINAAIAQLVAQPLVPFGDHSEALSLPQTHIFRTHRTDPKFLESTMGKLPNSVMEGGANVPVAVAKEVLQRVIRGRVDYYQNLDPNLMDPLVLTKIHKFQAALQDLAEDSLRKTIQNYAEPHAVQEELDRWAGFFEKWVNGSSVSKPYDTELLFSEVGRFSFYLDVQLELLLNVVHYGLSTTKMMDKEKEAELARKTQALVAEIIFRYHQTLPHLPEDLLQRLDQSSISLWTLDRFFSNENLALELIRNTPSLQEADRLRELAKILIQLHELRLLKKHGDAGNSQFGEEWIRSILSFYLSQPWSEIAPELEITKAADLLTYLKENPNLKVHAEKLLTPVEVRSDKPSDIFREQEKRVLLEKVTPPPKPEKSPPINPEGDVYGSPLPLPPPANQDAAQAHALEIMCKLYPKNHLYDRLRRSMYKYFLVGLDVDEIIDGF